MIDPSREFCTICNRYSSLSFYSPDHIYNRCIEPGKHQHVCLPCFIVRADERLIDWTEGLTIYASTLLYKSKCQEFVQEDYGDQLRTENERLNEDIRWCRNGHEQNLKMYVDALSGLNALQSKIDRAIELCEKHKNSYWEILDLLK